MGLDALDQSICAVLGSDEFQENTPTRPCRTSWEVRFFCLLFLELVIVLKLGIDIACPWLRSLS